MLWAFLFYCQWWWYAAQSGNNEGGLHHQFKWTLTILLTRAVKYSARITPEACWWFPKASGRGATCYRTFKLMLVWLFVHIWVSKKVQWNHYKHKITIMFMPMMTGCDPLTTAAHVFIVLENKSMTWFLKTMKPWTEALSRAHYPAAPASRTVLIKQKQHRLLGICLPETKHLHLSAFCYIFAPRCLFFS